MEEVQGGNGSKKGKKVLYSEKKISIKSISAGDFYDCRRLTKSFLSSCENNDSGSKEKILNSIPQFG
jgi:catabolite regulation protein CreA